MRKAIDDMSKHLTDLYTDDPNLKQQVSNLPPLTKFTHSLWDEIYNIPHEPKSQKLIDLIDKQRTVTLGNTKYKHEYIDAAAATASGVSVPELIADMSSSTQYDAVRFEGNPSQDVVNKLKSLESVNHMYIESADDAEFLTMLGKEWKQADRGVFIRETAAAAAL